MTNNIEVAPLRLQRTVKKQEIRVIRQLRTEGFAIKKIAKMVHRSPRTVQHYLESNERMT